MSPGLLRTPRAPPAVPSSAPRSSARSNVPAAETARRISSRNTFFLKRVFPLLWFGMVALAGGAGRAGARAGKAVPPPVFIVPLLLLVIGYAIMRKLVFDLADEVFDEGAALRVRFGSEEQRIALTDIINVGYTQFVNPPRITLTLRQPGRFGREVSFSPPQSFFAPFVRNRLASELIERVEAARRRRTRPARRAPGPAPPRARAAAG